MTVLAQDQAENGPDSKRKSDFLITESEVPLGKAHSKAKQNKTKYI